MSTPVWVVLVTVALLAGLLAGFYFTRRWVIARQGVVERMNAAIFDLVRERALSEVLAGVTVDGVRREIRVIDGGGSRPEAMRYRWEVWNADRMLILQTTDGPLGEDEIVGVGLPLMLGDAPSQSSAYTEALHWVLSRKTGAGVVL